MDVSAFEARAATAESKLAELAEKMTLLEKEIAQLKASGAVQQASSQKKEGNGLSSDERAELEKLRIENAKQKYRINILLQESR